MSADKKQVELIQAEHDAIKDDLPNIMARAQEVHREAILQAKADAKRVADDAKLPKPEKVAIVKVVENLDIPAEVIDADAEKRLLKIVADAGRASKERASRFFDAEKARRPEPTEDCPLPPDTSGADE